LIAEHHQEYLSVEVNPLPMALTDEVPLKNLPLKETQLS
jgi:hypothetical protein